jgi:hypothetical protein
MGTSHRHTPGVTGEPNWGKASSAITAISKAVVESDELENAPSKDKTSKDTVKKQQSIDRRIRNGYHRAVRDLVRAAGGRSAVASGTSKAMGHAGVAWATSWSRAFQEIAEQGLSSWLESKGLQITGKSCHEIVSIIGDFIKEDFVGLDDTAAKEAMSYVMGLVEEKAGGDSEEFDKVFNQILNTDEIKEYIDQFFGIYIFSHISQNFQEKLEKKMGIDKAVLTMEEIKGLILDDVRRGFNGKSAEQINFKSTEGEAFIKSEFDRMIKIFIGNED